MRLFPAVLAALALVGAVAWALPFPRGGGGPNNTPVMIDASDNVMIDNAGNVMTAPPRPVPTPPVPAILSVSLTGNGAFIPGISGAAGTAQASWTGTVGTITWTLQTTGTDHTGAACGTAPSFAINSSTGTITNPTGATTTVTPCAVATASAGGVSGSPYVQRVQLLAGAISMTTISPNPSQFTQGATAGTVIGTLSTTMSPPSLSFSGGSYALSTATPTCNGTNGANNNLVQISGSQLQVSSAGSSATAGSYQTCLHASIGSISGGTNFPLTISSGSMIACDVGPSFAGSVPAPAAAAGFTHCVANYDFTQTSSFTSCQYPIGAGACTGSTSYQWSTLSSWLECAGASQPLLFSKDYGIAINCGDVSVTTDTSTAASGSQACSGCQVLLMQFKPTDTNSQTWLSADSQNNQPNSQGVRTAMGFYIEEVMRTDSGTYNSGQSWNPGVLFFDFWMGTGCHNGITCNDDVEFDFVEMYGSGSGGGNGTMGPAIHFGSGAQYYPGGAAINPFQYNTYGALATVRSSLDGSGHNLEYCAMVNGISPSAVCDAIGLNQTEVDSYINEFFPGMVGPQRADNQCGPGGTQSCSPTQNQNAYIQRMTLWACPTYSVSATSPAPCHTSSLVSY